MSEEEYCNTGLCLSIGGGGGGGGGGDFSSNRCGRDLKSPFQFHILFPHPLKEVEKEEDNKNRSTLNSQPEEDRVIANGMREGDSNRGGKTKKLRLTKEQSTLLEDSFRAHSTLTSARKNYLAQRLNLKPRQVEVWFQNRRARTKLKQIEEECELLKESWESLMNENRKLKRELMEMRSSMKPVSPFYVQLSKAATLTICPSCKKMAPNNDRAEPGYGRRSEQNKPRLYGCSTKDF